MTGANYASSSLTDESFSYDKNGNRTKRTKTSDSSYTVYAYDVRNRLISATDYNASNAKQKSVAYGYDAFNDRVIKDIDTNGDGTVDTKQRFAYDGDSLLVARNSSGAATNRYLLGPLVDQVLADEQITSQSSAGDVFWDLADHEQSIRDIVQLDTAGGTYATLLRDHVVYTSFGAPTDSSSTVKHAFGYTGQIYEAETGLGYFKARYYDPKLGKFISDDPAKDGTNLSEYAGNSPIVFTDPTGLSAFSSNISLPGSLSGYTPSSALSTGGWYAPLLPSIAPSYSPILSPAPGAWTGLTGAVSSIAQNVGNYVSTAYAAASSYASPAVSSVSSAVSSAYVSAIARPAPATYGLPPSFTDYDILTSAGPVEAGRPTVVASYTGTGTNWIPWQRDVYSDGSERVFHTESGAPGRLDARNNFVLDGYLSAAEAQHKADTELAQLPAVARIAYEYYWATPTRLAGVSDRYPEVESAGERTARNASQVFFNWGTTFGAAATLSPSRPGIPPVTTSESFFRASGEYGMDVSKPPSAPTPQGMTLELSFQEGMDLSAFKRKVGQLQYQVEQGNAIANLPHGISDAARRSMTSAYRRDLVQRAQSMYANQPTALQNALEKLRQSDIDHILDLQLNGANVRSNLNALHSGTNQLLGSQISRQLPVGQRVPITEIRVKE